MHGGRLHSAIARCGAGRARRRATATHGTDAREERQVAAGYCRLYACYAARSIQWRHERGEARAHLTTMPLAGRGWMHRRTGITYVQDMHVKVSSYIVGFSSLSHTDRASPLIVDKVREKIKARRGQGRPLTTVRLRPRSLLYIYVKAMQGQRDQAIPKTRNIMLIRSSGQQLAAESSLCLKIKLFVALER